MCWHQSDMQILTLCSFLFPAASHTHWAVLDSGCWGGAGALGIVLVLRGACAPWLGRARGPGPPSRDGARAERHGNAQQARRRHEQQPLPRRSTPACPPLQDLQLQGAVSDGSGGCAQTAGERLLLGRCEWEGGQRSAEHWATRHFPGAWQLWQPPLFHLKRENGHGHQEPAHPMWRLLLLFANRPTQLANCATFWLCAETHTSLYAFCQRSRGRVCSHIWSGQWRWQQWGRWEYILHLLWRRENPTGAAAPSGLQHVHTAAPLPQDT